AHVEHVVGSAGHAEAPGRARARTGPGSRDGEHVARLVPHQRLAFLGEMGADQLARRPLPDRQALARPRLEQLGEPTVSRVEMQIARVLALAPEDRHDLGEAEIRVPDRESPGLLQPVAESLVVESALAAEEAEREAERTGLSAHLLAQYLLEESWIRWGAVDARDAELDDRLQQLPGVPDAEWHGGRPARLDDHVVGDAAGPQLVVEAMHDEQAGARAGAEHRPSTQSRYQLDISLRETDGERAASGARGLVDAHHPLGRASHMVAPGRPRLLSDADLFFVGER